MKLAAGLAAVALVACGGSNKQPSTSPTTTGGSPPATEPAVATKPAPDKPAAAKTLYDRLGGNDAITAVVVEFLTRTTNDPRIKDRFFNADAPKLQKLLVQLVCVAAGGPCKYEGRDMVTVHAGMDLSDDEFGALVENLVGALDKYKVPEKEKGEVLGALGPLKPQIVAPADHFHPIDKAKLDAVTKLAAALKNDPHTPEDKVTETKRLLGVAVVAGERGQLSYAEQLFTRAEMTIGPKPLAKIAATFRGGAPERITTPTKPLKDAGPQPVVVGKDDEAEAPAPKKLPAKATIGMLHGKLTVDGKPPGFGVIMLTPEKGGAKRTAKQRVIEQRNREFAPHVMAVPVGSTVSFPNYDPIFHNVFSRSKTKAFDLGMYKTGEARDIKLDKPGVVRLGCNIHANMAAYIVVVDAPHYVVVEPDGAFAFKALAPGKYKLSAWDELSGDPVVSAVEIKEGDNTQDLDLKAGAGGLGTDKFGDQR